MGRTYLIHYAGLLIGILYVVAGTTSLFNIFLANLLGGELFLVVKYVPGDVGLCLILFSIGFTLLASSYYYYRGEKLISLSCLLVGSGLGVLSSVIHMLTVFADVLDRFITGCSVDITYFVEKVLRVDFVLGLLSLPILL